MRLEFFTPEEAAEALRCTEQFLTEHAEAGTFPHVVWGQETVVFTSDDLEEIAAIRAVRVTKIPADTPGPATRRPTLNPPARSGVRVIAPTPRQRNRGRE